MSSSPDDNAQVGSSSSRALQIHANIGLRKATGNETQDPGSQHHSGDSQMNPGGSQAVASGSSGTSGSVSDGDPPRQVSHLFTPARIQVQQSKDVPDRT